jgi:RNA polymerase sigma-70 factor, ECF subfamily
MDHEARIDACLRAGDLQNAATSAVEAYGPEVLGFLVTLLRDESDASEAFSQACEDLWRGLPGFQQRASMRTWFYTLARHAAARLRRSPSRAPRRRLPLTELSEVADGVRSRTLPYLRSEVKDQFAAIREGLDESDRALLVLRVDRRLDWLEIARVFCDDDPSEGELVRTSGRLRKRFQAVKLEIRRRASELGLLREDRP